MRKDVKEIPVEVVSDDEPGLLQQLILRVLMSEAGKVARVGASLILGIMVKNGLLEAQSTGSYTDLITSTLASLILAVGEVLLTRLRKRNTKPLQELAAKVTGEQIKIDGNPGPISRNTAVAGLDAVDTVLTPVPPEVVAENFVNELLKQNDLAQREILLTQLLNLDPDKYHRVRAVLDRLKAQKRLPSLIPMRTPEEIKDRQRLLRDKGYNPGAIDGLWGSRTEKANNAYERETGDIWKRDDRGNVPTSATKQPDTNPENAMAPAMGSALRIQAYGGPRKWIHDPQPGNYEYIKILDDWDERNIITVEVPQLSKIPGNFHRATMHKLVEPQFAALWKAWEQAGLLKQILSWEGMYNPRLIRGSSTVLSNHAQGSAFDINYEWNQLSKVPAAAGTRGSVRELVPIAHALGWFWGGNFSRKDGMHFEICKLLTPGDLNRAFAALP